MSFNDVIVWMLQSPLHGMMSGNLMAVEVTGRKSGSPVRLPVNYRTETDGLWVVSSRERVWWRNLQVNPGAVLWLRGRQVSAQGKVFLEENLVKEHLANMVSADARLAQAFKIGLDENQRPLAEDLDRVARERLLVRFSVS